MLLTLYHKYDIMCKSIRDRLISARRHLRAADRFYHNLQNALIGEDVRCLCRVQGLILLRFFAKRHVKTVFFDNLFYE